MKQRAIYAVCVTVMAFLLLIRCTAPTGGATETGNARVTAMLYNQGGTPAVNAKVCFYPHDNDPRPGKGTGPVDSTTTDANGNYTVELDSGTYNILAILGDNATFQDSIVVRRDDTTKPPPDTVKPLGSISGKIKLQGTDDPRTVFVLFMGSNTFAPVMDTQGNFSAANMAKGRYRVRILTTLDNYRVMDTAFEISAGKDSVMKEPIRLEYTGIPVVEGVGIEYDTMKQIVTLRWNKAATTLVNGYYVYRRNEDSNTALARINTSPITDTVYRDSTGIQDQTYEYRIASVDKNATEGVKSAGVSVKVVGAFVWIDTIGNGVLTNPGEFKIDKNGNFIVPDIVPTSGNHSVMVFDSNYNLISSFGKGIVDFPFSTEIDSEGNIYVGAKNGVFKFSNNGIIVDTFFITSSGFPTAFLKIYNSQLYISYSGEIRKYSLQGDSLLSWGGVGTNNGQFEGGSSVGIWAYANQVYICEQEKRRIQIFDLNGNYTSEWVSPFSSYPTMQPLRISMDSASNFYVVTQSPNSVLIFDSTKNYLGKIDFEEPTPDIRGTYVRGNRIFIAMGNSIRVYSLPKIH